MLIRCVVFCSLLLIAISGNRKNDKFKAVVEKEMQTFDETGKVGNILKNIVADLESDASLNKWGEPKISLFCTTCAVGVNRILAAPNKEGIFNESITLCIELGLGNPVFCEGIVLENELQIIWLANNTADETGQDVCATIFCGMGCRNNNPARVWEVPLPPVPKPPVDEPPYPQLGSVPVLKVLHLSDTHFDPNYLPGSNTQCPEVYFCCNADSGPVVNPEDAAGFWGDYRNCDLPMWTIEALYAHISETHPDIDFIIWTGDIVPHIVWDITREGNLAILHSMADLLLRYFPDVPVFPAVGNHEADPMNLFPQPYITDPELEITWLYTELANIWSNWLPVETAASIAYSAYYVTQVRPGLRIVSINTMYCYGYNYWLVYDSTDIANELLHLAEELQNAEDVGDRVYIIGHIPPGNHDCSLMWSHEFNKIVSRYEDTVTGMFYGHTHKDHYQIFFDPVETSRPYDIAYIAQSQTSYSNLNPGYKIYTIEGDFVGSRYRVLDHENWILDLQQANLLNVTNIFKLYSAKDDYRMPDLSPQSWLDLVVEMSQPNSTVFNDFYRNYVKGGAPSLAEGCDDKCKNEVLCRLLVSDNSDHTQCIAMGLE